MRVAGSTMLITGASQGLGHHMAIRFAREGARVVLAARNEDNLRRVADAIAEAGGVCMWFTIDLRDSETLEAMVAQLDERQWTVDILVNNAADVTSKPLLETSPAEIDSLLRTNMTGALQLTRLLLPRMVARGSGMIINVSSLAGYKANPGQTVYSISKTGVNGMSAALRAELRGSGISVINVGLSSVGPGAGQVSVDVFLERLERAILREEPELFLSSLTKWLMRLYGTFPWLASLR
jgi:short-subunit dehydrogenase